MSQVCLISGSPGCGKTNWILNTFNAGTIVDGGPPPPFWIVLIVNPLLCIYGLVNNKN